MNRLWLCIWKPEHQLQMNCLNTYLVYDTRYAINECTTRKLNRIGNYFEIRISFTPMPSKEGASISLSMLSIQKKKISFKQKMSKYQSFLMLILNWILNIWRIVYFCGFLFLSEIFSNWFSTTSYKFILTMYNQ